MERPTHPGASSEYAERVGRHVPGLQDLHRIIALLLAERVPPEGDVLVLGAGGGLETRAMADLHPGWRFLGVDPSAQMIGQAKDVLGTQVEKVRFHQGYVDDAPEGPFDGATSLLVLHFLERDERVRTVRDVVKRLKPGAPFVTVHHSFPKTRPDPDRWLRRNASFVTGSAVPNTRTEEMVSAMRDRLPALSPDEDEAVLREAGLVAVEMFYAALTFKGWIAYRPAIMRAEAPAGPT